MNEELLDILRCPCCGGSLDFELTEEPPTAGQGQLVGTCGRSFAVLDGIPNLVYPADQSYLYENADTYERDIDFIARLLNVEQDRVRHSLIDLLDLRPNAHVLEVACGPGSNLPYVLEAVGSRAVNVNRFETPSFGI